MLNIFSYVCWPSVWLLWRNVYWDLLSIILIGLFFSVIELHELFVLFWRVIHCCSHHLIIFSPILWVVFSFVMVSFAVQNLLSLPGSICLFLFLFSFGDGSEKIFLWFMSKSVLSMFSSKSFIVFALHLGSLIHLEFIYVHGVKEFSNCIVNVYLSSFPSSLLKRLFFLTCIFLLTFSQINWA